MLSKKYDFREIEKKWQDFWQETGIYNFDINCTKEIYSIDTPPPTVSGSLHMGHIFSYTQGEIAARYHRMQGKNVFYPFGFDDNGLPTERLVEREENIRAKDLPRSQFIEKCLNTTEKYVGEFKVLWQSLGFSVDWKLQYETISPLAQRISQRSFIELAKGGKAYSKDSPVLWCTTCQTSIAQAELETTEVETTFNYIPFMVDNEELIVATTRPELLYGCVALFINPKDDRYSSFIGKNVLVPIYNFEIPILGDEKVELEKGTGLVMCATFGDTLDLEWYQRHSLPYKKVIETDGLIATEVPYISGMDIKAARNEIIKLLEENNLLKKTEKITHTISIHERCGHGIEIIPSKQWYIDILSKKDLFLEAADEINWYPSSMKIRYQSWVENLKWDWCISRQRYFGVPLPIWYCKSCGAAIFPEEHELPVNPLESMPSKPCTCGCNEFTPEDAILDTWATSSLTPLINSKWGEKLDITDKLLPMGMRTQAHEIIRTWAFYTIVKSLYHTGKLPWKDIMISGFVMAKKGEKISKSKNNSENSPKQLIEKYSADAIRYWASGAKLGTDTMYSEEDMILSNRFITKLWNAAKFTLMHLQDFNGEKPEKLLPVDNWIIARSRETETTAAKYMNKYEMGIARGEIDEFFWKDYCDNYLEIVKERVYKPEIHGEQERKSGQYALYTAFMGILRMYAIYIPHITEEIYQDYFRNIEGKLSLHQHIWINENIDSRYISFGEKIKEILREVRKSKSDKNLSMKEPLEKLTIYDEETNLDMLLSIKKDLIACTSAKELCICEGNEFGMEIKE